MSLGDEFRRVAELVERLESSGVAVAAAERLEDGGGDDSVRVRLEVEVPAGDARPASAVESVDSGSGTPEVDAGSPPDPPDEGSGSDGADGNESAAVACRHPDCGERFETEHGMKIHHTKTHVSADDPPAYRDPERLREAYETCDTLEEMRDRLGADVTVTTIRRQLIDHGIHEADGDRTPDDGEADTADADPGSTPDDGTEETDADVEPDDNPDDREVAPGVTAGELSDAVEGARTLYDVERALDVDRETAMDLLRRFELLEAVHGRVADEDVRTELREQVADQFGSGAESAD